MKAKFQRSSLGSLGTMFVVIVAAGDKHELQVVVINELLSNWRRWGGVWGPGIT